MIYVSIQFHGETYDLIQEFMDSYNFGDYTEIKNDVSVIGQTANVSKFGRNQFRGEEIDELILKLIENSRGVDNQKIEN